MAARPCLAGQSAPPPPLVPHARAPSCLIRKVRRSAAQLLRRDSQVNLQRWAARSGRLLPKIDFAPPAEGSWEAVIVNNHYVPAYTARPFHVREIERRDRTPRSNAEIAPRSDAEVLEMAATFLIRRLVRPPS